MSGNECETVRVVSPEAPGGFVIINASDFDEKKHKVFEVETEQEDKPRKGKR